MSVEESCHLLSLTELFEIVIGQETKETGRLCLGYLGPPGGIGLIISMQVGYFNHFIDVKYFLNTLFPFHD